MLRFLDFAVAGVSFGAIVSLSAMGLVLTYRATGVFNVAHGAVAMIVAYLLWQTTTRWQLPLAVMAPLALLVIGPGIGVALSRLVFAPLARRAAGTAEQLVAALGVFVLLVGIASQVWGFGTQANAPSILPDGGYQLPGGVRVGADTLSLLAGLCLTAVLLGQGFARTRLGRQLRAVVDRRRLAELVGVDAAAMSDVSWALGCGFAGLTGVLLAPSRGLSPYGLTLTVVETFAAAALARLTSLPRAVAAGLALGVAQSEMVGFRAPGRIGALLDNLAPNLLVVAFLVTLLVLRRLDLLGDRVSGDTALTAASMGRRHRLGPARSTLAVLMALTAAFGPLYLAGPDLRAAQKAVALAIIFCSITAVTGYSGQISLGQGGFAGLGALVAGSLASGTFFGQRTPELPALAVAVLIAVGLGALVGFPALRRRGLFLALTTLAVAEVLYRLLFLQVTVTRGLHEPRPSLLGLALTGDRAFYSLELAALLAALALMRNLRSGRLGRALGALRDSEDGARAVGLSLRTYTLFIFATSAGLAALGGALYAQSERGFDASTFDPLAGLFWFVAVVVAGTGSALGAVLAAAAVVAIDSSLGPGTSTVFIGALAVLLGRLPGGIDGTLARLRRQVAPSRAGTAAAEQSPADRPLAGYRLSRRGRQVLAARGRP